MSRSLTYKPSVSEPCLVDDVDRAAEAAGLSRNRWLGLAIREKLGLPLPEPHACGPLEDFTEAALMAALAKKRAQAEGADNA